MEKLWSYSSFGSIFVLLLSYIAFKMAEDQTGALNVDIVDAVGTASLE